MAKMRINIRKRQVLRGKAVSPSGEFEIDLVQRGAFLKEAVHEE